MKRILAIVMAAVIVLCICSCAKKTQPEIKINADSVSSVDFKKTCFSDTDTDSRSYKQKTVTESSDISSLASWLAGLRLSKHEAIEVPVEKVAYVIVFNGKTQHKVIFMDEFIIYDGTAYTFERQSDLSTVTDKYNLVNYPETDTELELIN